MTLKHFKVAARFTGAYLHQEIHGEYPVIFEEHSSTRDVYAKNPEQAQQDFLDELELGLPVFTLHSIKVWEIK